jgi:toxin FitB
MIVLDTNVISELMKSSPSSKVSEWIDQQETSQLFVTTITIAEISYGIHALPKGKKRQSIETAFHNSIRDAFEHRLLEFTEKAAHIYGKMMGERKKIGRPLSILDGQIAAITLAEKASLATRNVRDFQHYGLILMNPFI